MVTARETWTEKLGKGAMAFVLACGLMLPTAALMVPQQALADVNNTEAAYLTVNRANSANADSAYLGYQVFKADITYTNGEATGQNIDWASTNARDAVLGFIAAYTNDQSAATTYANANAAANYITAQIAADLDNNAHVDTAANTTPPTTTGGSFATSLAYALATASPAVSTSSITAGQATQLAEGYWLIATNPNSLTIDDGGSAPIWIAMSSADTAQSPRTVNAKEFRPGATFQIKEDSSGTFGAAADSNRDQNLDYQIVGTLPQNFAAYPSFADTYTVSVPSGISVANGTSGFSVTVGGSTTLTKDASSNGFTVSESSGTYTISIANMKAIDGAASSANVTINFQASLNANANTGSTGNTVTVGRTYTSDPVALGTSSITPLSVVDYTYEIDATKVYKSNAATTLPGATFMIKAATDAGTASAGNAWYVSQTGSLVEASETPATAASNTNLVFTSDSNGAFTVPMVDQGVYTIIETAPPAGYAEQDADITLTLTAPSPLSGNLDSVTISGGEVATNSSEASPTAAVDGTNAHIVNLQITDDKIIVMPLTGLPGYVGVTVIGLVLIVVGFGGMILLRRTRNKKPLQP